MTVYELDYTMGVAPLKVTARLFTTEFVTWHWLIDGVKQEPTDSWSRVFVFTKSGAYMRRDLRKGGSQ